MTGLTIRPADECRWDVCSLGEVMLRLDPGEGRIRTARRFDVWEGGGEYNVARGLARVFGHRATVLTSLVDDEVGRLVEGLVLAGGVDVSHVAWRVPDGVGREVRNGINFTERGFGVRAAKGVSDRGNTATSQLSASDLDLDRLFSEGVRWLHTGGIYAGLSERSGETCVEVVRRAKEAGAVVSYDLNYRPSLWQSIGGEARAQEVNRAVAPYVDVMLGNEEDFTKALGFQLAAAEDLTDVSTDAVADMLAQVGAAFPQFRVIATTLRGVRSASRNDWRAVAWSPEKGLVESVERADLEVLDRVGGGDSFASGLIHGLLSGQSLQRNVELGAAHGALAMTTPGDTSMASAAEVEKLADGGNARVDR